MVAGSWTGKDTLFFFHLNTLGLANHEVVNSDVIRRGGRGSG